MADDFRGASNIIIQPGDTSVPYYFKLSVSTSSERNDGALPYNSSMVKCSVVAKRSEGGAVVTTQLIKSTTEDGNTIITKLQYSSGLLKGLHTLTFNVTASVAGTTASPMVKEFDFTRVFVKDIR